MFIREIIIIYDTGKRATPMLNAYEYTAGMTCAGAVLLDSYVPDFSRINIEIS